jgi:hypothetical protein
MEKCVQLYLRELPNFSKDKDWFAPYITHIAFISYTLLKECCFLD